MSKLDIKDTSETLFGNIQKQARKNHKDNNPNIRVNEPPVRTQKHVRDDVLSTPSEDSNISHSEQATVDKVSVFITSEQRDILDKLAKNAMRRRSISGVKAADRERITSNTILRALLQNFIERESLLTNEIINSEDQAKHWIERLFKDAQRK